MFSGFGAEKVLINKVQKVLTINKWLINFNKAFLVAQMVKHTPAMQETWVQSLAWKEPLEKEKATHSSILAWRISWTEDILN